MLEIKEHVAELLKSINSYQQTYDPSARTALEKEIQERIARLNQLPEVIELGIGNTKNAKWFEKVNLGLSIVPTIVAIGLVFYMSYFVGTYKRRMAEEIGQSKVKNEIISNYQQAAIRFYRVIDKEDSAFLGIINDGRRYIQRGDTLRAKLATKDTLLTPFPTALSTLP